MCYTYLDVVPPKGDAIVGSMIKLKWLCDNMSLLLEQPTQQQLEAHCRTFILGLIWGGYGKNWEKEERTIVMIQIG